ncbi:MAG TPA: EF-P lysine aminoacylase EpmA [Polyangiaceae bacterium]|nr:EF-P lysine aminoacylase EpmA [Polyangiaceae bacterium]
MATDAPAERGLDVIPRSPHELLGQPGSPSSVVRAGGRLRVEGGATRLVDAFVSVPVELRPGASAEHEALAVVEGVWDGRTLGAARVLHAWPSARPALEWQRLFDGGIGARLRERAQLMARTRRFFEAEGFLEVDTPLRSAECGTETHVEPIASGDHYLITSPELHMKRLLAGGVPKLFGLVHCFRAGERGHLHSPEFSLLEWYRAFAGYTAVLEDTERLIHALHRSLVDSDELRLASGARIDLRPPFLRLGVREAFARYAGVSDAAELAARDEDSYFQLLVDRVEPALAELERPVFLVDYPASQAALARLCPHDPSVAERFELYLGGVELCNGYGELTDPVEQRARCESDRARRRELGRHVPEVPGRFLCALEEGMPPASGNALGMDRLIMLLLGQERIDRVMPFANDQV